MSWVRVWIHIVFATKNREPFLNSFELRKKVFRHIKENSKAKGIYLDSVNGFEEHVHCLISLGREQSISKTAQLIKGESAFWINKNNLTNNYFVWQDDYWAASVSQDHLKKLRKYIFNQEEHHKSKLFMEEVEEFVDKYGDDNLTGN